jgi:hypothetical protein
VDVDVEGEEVLGVKMGSCNLERENMLIANLSL